MESRESQQTLENQTNKLARETKIKEKTQTATRKGIKPPPQKLLTMSHFAWNDVAINFTLSANTAGICPANIHTQLVLNGYSRLQLYTVEQCLRVRGREIDNVDPNYRPPYNENTAAAIIYGHCIAWNDLARTFSMSAYRVGFSVGQIWYQLIQNGYAVSTAEVAASLSAQGIGKNMRLVDYLRAP